MAAAGKLERHHIEPLVQLATSGFCMHRSWGFGRIRTVDTVFARFTIDFQDKTGHAMDLGFAAESLKPIGKDHILARKAVDLQAHLDGEVFQPLRDVDYFRTVLVNQDIQTIVWDNDADFSPDFLYEIGVPAGEPTPAR